MRAPAPGPKLALRIRFTCNRDPVLQLKQFDRRQYLPHQDAAAIARAEDHHGADTYGHIKIGNDLRKRRLRRLRNGVGGVQGEMGPVVSIWVRALRLRHSGRSQAITLRDERRLG